MSSGDSVQNGHKLTTAEIRKEILELDNKRTQIENEIKDYQLILRSGVGMDDPLTDREGFPRNDIDIHQVRIARNRIICLNNDHLAIMKQIGDKMEGYYHQES